MTNKKSYARAIAVIGILASLGLAAALYMYLMGDTRNITPPSNRTRIEKQITDRVSQNIVKQHKIESTISGSIVSIDNKSGDEIEFTVQDSSRNNAKFRFRLSSRAEITKRTVDLEKEVITISTVVDQKPFSSLKAGIQIDVKTIDPLDARGPLQALRVTIIKPPSKNP